MEKTNEIERILLEIQQGLNVPKNQFNKFGGFAYRSAEDILAELKPQLKVHECIGWSTSKPIEVGGRVYIEVTYTIRHIKTGQSFATVGIAREPENKKGMDESQMTGSANSYALKYALSSMFHIDDTKDGDYVPNEKKPEPKPKLKKGTQSWKDVLKGLNNGYTIDQVEGKYYIDPKDKDQLLQEAAEMDVAQVPPKKK